MADHPLRSATDHRLGRPLPHQPANRTQAPRPASPKALSFTPPLGSEAHAELPPVSGSYPPPDGRLPTWSSPVRHVSGPKTTPFDLHALGTPPALILSQDQTLHQMPVSLRRVSPRPPVTEEVASSHARDAPAASTDRLTVCCAVLGPCQEAHRSPPWSCSVFHTHKDPSVSTNRPRQCPLLQGSIATLRSA